MRQSALCDRFEQHYDKHFQFSPHFPGAERVRNRFGSRSPSRLGTPSVVRGDRLDRLPLAFDTMPRTAQSGSFLTAYFADCSLKKVDSMSYNARVFNVMIASPSDVVGERDMVRLVIHEWNAAHSQARKVALMPIGWETHSNPEMGDRPQGIINRQLLENTDLLVAMFWNRLGTDTGEFDSGTVEEIERHIATGKPAMIYFSSALSDAKSADQKQLKAVVKFRESLKSKGLYCDYNTLSDFREKIRQHMATIVNTSPYFAEAIQADSARGVTPGDPMANLSEEAERLLLAAAADDGTIRIGDYVLGASIQVGGINFVSGADHRTEVKWKAAIQELLHLGLIVLTGAPVELYELTHNGYELAKRLDPLIDH